MSPRSPARNSPGFARRQLALAAAAFHMGEVGAACAALRVLRAEDFVDRYRAADCLARLRRHAEGLEARSRAVEELLRLGDASSDRINTSREDRGSDSGSDVS
jgi:hypothetical protein